MLREDVDAEAVAKEFAGCDEELALVGDDVSHVVGEAAVREGDVRAAIVKDDLGRLVEATQARRRGGSARDTAYDEDALGHDGRPLS